MASKNTIQQLAALNHGLKPAVIALICLNFLFNFLCILKSFYFDRSQNERAKSAQLRSNTDILINSVATLVWDNWSNTNNSLNKRSSEMCEAKNNIQLHLHKTQQEIFDIERNIDLIRKAIQDKANPLKVAQTRLEARGHRAGIEQCK